MSDDKNNIFVQLYKPSQQVQQADGTQNVSIHTATPEQFPYNPNTPVNEYAPILEYIEPQIDPVLEQHIQNANPQFVPQQNIPLTPTHTPPVPGIQQMTIPTLPLTEIEIEQDFKTNVYTAIRWLAEWCLRQLQIIRERSNDISQ